MELSSEDKKILHSFINENENNSSSTDSILEIIYKITKPSMKENLKWTIEYTIFKKRDAASYIRFIKEVYKGIPVELAMEVL